MGKKHTFKKTAALFLGATLTVGATGCNFLLTDSEKNLKQVVASVDISESMKNDETYGSVAQEVSQVLEQGGFTTDIYKRDLIAYFLGTGYTYVEQYGYTYEDTFNMLLDGLIDREIMLQYAIAYYLKNNDDITAEGCQEYIVAQTESASEKEKEKLQKYPEVLAMKYFLTDGGKTEVDGDYDPLEEYNRVVYTLKKSFNDSLDSLETSYIQAEEDNHDHGEVRTLPTNADAQKSDYYTLDYEIYTGRNTPDKCGEYERVDGSTSTTRQKAYNAFLANLQSYNLIVTKGANVENTADVMMLDYYYVELSSLLGQALINKYFDALTDEATALLTDAYVANKYNAIYAQQELAYATNPTAFDTALDGLSDDSFVLYGQEGFGFVYNILLPFSASQTVEYNEAKNRGLSQDAVFMARRSILNNVVGKDLRDSWISTHDHANYSYEKDGKYYFFEGNLTNDKKYESLTHYAGGYAYNGTVTKNEAEDKYEFKANELKIGDSNTGFINEFESYIKKVSGVSATGATKDAYINTTKFSTNGKVDYSNFMYYEGKVNFTETPKASDYFNPNSESYKAVSAVNELMFAYSTDPGCLNTYKGYAVSPYGTDFVPEFEYAAQYAVSKGVGTYVVCATDYGWHIIYTTFAYGAGDVYGGYVAADKDVEGTFSNMFYESLKKSLANNHANETQSSVLNQYDNDDCVTRFKSRYKDLLELDA
ncbi:MAG: hypothetical protein J6A38_00620 [Clostridia bacterium]|nr:hypothetical protein [Clostridia bacterium]